MALPAGGWTVDEVAGRVLNKRGWTNIVFRDMVAECLAVILVLKEKAGTLTTAETALKNSGDVAIDRCIEFVINDGTPATNAYATRGIYMRNDEITTAINNQWTNIVKQWS